MCLKIDKTLIGMGLTTADVPTPRVSALMRLKSQNCPQMSVHTSSRTHTHTHTHTHTPTHTVKYIYRHYTYQKSVWAFSPSSQRGLEVEAARLWAASRRFESFLVCPKSWRTATIQELPSPLQFPIVKDKYGNKIKFTHRTKKKD